MSSGTTTCGGRADGWAMKAGLVMHPSRLDVLRHVREKMYQLTSSVDWFPITEEGTPTHPSPFRIHLLPFFPSFLHLLSYIAASLLQQYTINLGDEWCRFSSHPRQLVWMWLIKSMKHYLMKFLTFTWDEWRENLRGNSLFIALQGSVWRWTSMIWIMST